MKSNVVGTRIGSRCSCRGCSCRRITVVVLWRVGSSGRCNCCRRNWRCRIFLLDPTVVIGHGKELVRVVLSWRRSPTTVQLRKERSTTTKAQFQQQSRNLQFATSTTTPTPTQLPQKVELVSDPLAVPSPEPILYKSLSPQKRHGSKDVVMAVRAAQLPGLIYVS